MPSVTEVVSRLADPGRMAVISAGDAVLRR
jgi:hypothetical protein